MVQGPDMWRRAAAYSVLSTRYSVLPIIAAAAMLCMPLPARAQPEPAPAEWLPDAELTSVTFVNADRGWAAGDRGVIWHTSDGGRTWKLQNSGVTCRL